MRTEAYSDLSNVVQGPITSFDTSPRYDTLAIHPSFSSTWGYYDKQKMMLLCHAFFVHALTWQPIPPYSYLSYLPVFAWTYFITIACHSQRYLSKMSCSREKNISTQIFTIQISNFLSILNKRKSNCNWEMNL